MKSLLSLLRFFLFVLLSLNTMSIITLSFSLVARADHAEIGTESEALNDNKRRRPVLRLPSGGGGLSPALQNGTDERAKYENAIKCWHGVVSLSTYRPPDLPSQIGMKEGRPGLFYLSPIPSRPITFFPFPLGVKLNGGDPTPIYMRTRWPAGGRRHTDHEHDYYVGTVGNNSRDLFWGPEVNIRRLIETAKNTSITDRSFIGLNTALTGLRAPLTKVGEIGFSRPSAPDRQLYAGRSEENYFLSVGEDAEPSSSNTEAVRNEILSNLSSAEEKIKFRTNAMVSLGIRSTRTYSRHVTNIVLPELNACKHVEDSKIRESANRIRAKVQTYLTRAQNYLNG